MVCSSSWEGGGDKGGRVCVCGGDGGGRVCVCGGDEGGRVCVCVEGMRVEGLGSKRLLPVVHRPALAMYICASQTVPDDSGCKVM